MRAEGDAAPKAHHCCMVSELRGSRPAMRLARMVLGPMVSGLCRDLGELITRASFCHDRIFRLSAP